MVSDAGSSTVLFFGNKKEPVTSIRV